MASSINIVVIEGNIGKDAETKILNNNNTVTSFSVAVKKSYKDKSGEWNDKTSWINVAKWNASDYLKAQLIKGQHVTVHGELVQESWESNGKTNYKTYVNAEKISTHKKVEGSGSDSYTESSTEENEDLPF